MNFGRQTDEADSHAIMDRAHDQGVNFFDTANVYGFDAGKGAPSEILGTWFAQGGDRREKTVLATKVYGSMGDWPNDTCCRRATSGARLRGVAAPAADRLDRPLPVPPRRPGHAVGGDLAGLRDLVAQGKVLYVGSSNYAGWHIAAANEAAGRRHFPGLVSEQSIYNLLTRHVELEVLPAAPSTTASAIIPWSPLHGGLLGGVLEKTGGQAAHRRPRQGGGRGAPRADQAYEALCRELGQAPADVALAWLLAQPAVTAPIIGPRTHGAVRRALAGARGPAGRGRAGPARRDLPRLRARAGALRLVSAAGWSGGLA